MHRDEGDLYACAGADPGEDLIPDPHAGAGGDFERVQHSGADDEGYRARISEGDVGAEDCDAAANDDGGEGDADEVGNGADTGAFGAGAFDGLEVEG